MTRTEGDSLERLNRLWSQLMVGLSRSGHRTEALAAYREVRKILTAELGIASEPVRPLTVTTVAELHAANEAEFIDLLRKIQVRSGLTLPEISRRAGHVLPRSQAYSLIRRRKLPTKAEQARAFATHCGLSESQVSRVMELWAELRELADSAAGNA